MTHATTTPRSGLASRPPHRAHILLTPILHVVRSNLGYYSGSHPNSADKRPWARIVLGWVTSREVLVSYPRFSWVPHATHPPRPLHALDALLAELDPRMLFFITHPCRWSNRCTRPSSSMDAIVNAPRGVLDRHRPWHCENGLASSARRIVLVKKLERESGSFSLGSPFVGSLRYVGIDQPIAMMVFG